MCVSVGDAWFVSPLQLFRRVVAACGEALAEYDYKLSVSLSGTKQCYN